MQPEPISIYIHWPFCKKKCPYCDFNSHVSKEIDYKLWQEAYRQEINYFLPYIKDRKIRSIFFGGGTPSLMPDYLVAGILDNLNKQLKFSQDIEITLEANPTSTEEKNFKAYKNAGVNRLSLGIQSLNQDDLIFLGRTHTVKESMQAINTAAEIFTNFSFDLIYARPSQTIEAWGTELELALSFNSKHISLYQLTIEKGTEFYSQYNKNLFKLPTEKISAKLYEMTAEILKEKNIFQYEISNYGQFGFESKHNLQYWNYGDYLGIGPGAHSRITLDSQKYALTMLYNPEKWLESVKNNGHGIRDKELLDSQVQLEEMLLMGLRLNQGIEINKIKKLTPDHNFSSAQIPAWLFTDGLIALDDNQLKITDKGRILSNSIIKLVIESFIY